MFSCACFAAVRDSYKTSITGRQVKKKIQKFTFMIELSTLSVLDSMLKVHRKEMTFLSKHAPQRQLKKYLIKRSIFCRQNIAQDDEFSGLYHRSAVAGV